ncbi:MAG TPA: heterocyst frequency control protein PatD [Stenomitos sp.]
MVDSPAPSDWLTLGQNVEGLYDLCTNTDNLEVFVPRASALHAQLSQDLQRCLTSSTADGSTITMPQRIATEMHRLLRLLAVDLAQYAASRSPEIQQQRRQQVCDRVEQLRQYTQALLKN